MYDLITFINKRSWKQLKRDTCSYAIQSDEELASIIDHIEIRIEGYKYLLKHKPESYKLINNIALTIINHDTVEQNLINEYNSYCEYEKINIIDCVMDKLSLWQITDIMNERLKSDY